MYVRVRGYVHKEVFSSKFFVQRIVKWGSITCFDGGITIGLYANR